MTGPLVMFVRPLPGTVGERDRVVHIVPVPNPDAIPDALTAYCGQEFPPGTTEMLSDPRGMPCLVCVVRVPRPEAPQLPEGSR